MDICSNTVDYLIICYLSHLTLIYSYVVYRAREFLSNN